MLVVDTCGDENLFICHQTHLNSKLFTWSELFFLKRNLSLLGAQTFSF